MRRIHLPILLRNVEESKANRFVVLFTLESACRALLMTLVPLQLYGLLKDAQTVSVVYLCVSVAGLVVSLVLPAAIHVFKRRWIMTIGTSCYVASAILFMQGHIWSAVLALLLQISATAALEVTISLYMLDHIPRRELNHFEPKRLLFSGMVFIAGPWVGVFLDRNVLENLTYLVVACTAALLLIMFWKFRLSDNQAIKAATKPPPDLLKIVPKFIKQPRLVLAWVLAVGRNGWWLMFFVYTPIFATEAGYSPEVGAALVSFGVMPMVFVRSWGRLGEKYGVRQLLVGAYLATGLATIAAGLSASYPFSWAEAGMVMMVAAAFFATMIDGAGNVPFLRAVHPYERAEMTSVYTTYRHGTSLATPGLFALVLIFLPLPFVFVAGGATHCGMALLSRYLPKRL